jgi:hypothetical protein
VSEVIPARITVPAENLKALMVWPAKALGSGHYRLVIQAGSLGFKDTSGQSITIENHNEDGSVISTFDVEVQP